MLRRYSSSSLQLTSLQPLNKKLLSTICYSSLFLSSSLRTCFSSSSTSRKILDLDDDEQDRIFQQALKKQQQEQKIMSGSQTNMKNKTQAELDKAILEERREKTNKFLNIIVDTGVESSSSTSTSDPREALQTVQDMITAAVKFQTLNANHIRRLFALCGAKQKEDASREMWIRMLSVISTVKEAERDLYFTKHNLYLDSHTTTDKQQQEGNDDDDERSLPPVIVTNEAWNALLGLSVEYVTKQRLRQGLLVVEATAGTENISSSSSSSSSSSISMKPQRSVLQSELELLLGSKQSEEPHWWILSKMDQEQVPVLNKNVLKFLASEVSIKTDSSGNSSREEELEKGENDFSKLKNEEKRSVLESRVEMVKKQMERMNV